MQMFRLKYESINQIYTTGGSACIVLQCFDAVGLAAGRASGLY